MAIEKIDAYWFAASDRLSHGDGREVIVGEKHSLSGEIVICKHALHASRQAFDALEYACGPYLYQVRCWGDVVEHDDKLGCRHREYVAMIDATGLLWQFAREQALSVIRFWNAPDVVRRYLETGDEAFRAAAWAAAWTADAARNADAARAAWAAVTRERFNSLVAEAFAA